MEFNATFLVSTVSFIVFIFIMNAILYKPVLAVMDKRAQYISNNKDEADKNKKEAECLIENKNRKISEAQRQSRDIVVSKADVLKEEKANAIAGAKEAASVYFVEQKQSLNSQKDEVLGNIRFDVKDIANKLTTKLMGEGVSFEPLEDREVDEVMKKNV